MITFKNFILESQSADETVQRAIDETKKQYSLFDELPFSTELHTLLTQLNRTLLCKNIVITPFSHVKDIQSHITFINPKQMDPEVLLFFERTVHSRVKKLFDNKVEIANFIVFEADSESWFRPADLTKFTYEKQPSFKFIAFRLNQK